MSLCENFIECICKKAVALVLFRPDYFCSKKLVQQKVGAGLGRRFADEYQEAIKAKFSRRSRRLAAMIGLQGSGGDESVCTGGLSFGHQKFEFTGLVAAKGKTGLVIAFNQ